MVLAGLLIALLLGAYTLAKILRDSLFITTFGARSLPYGYIAVAAAAAIFIWSEPRLIRSLKHSTASTVAHATAIGATVATALLFPFEKHWLVAAFYIWTGSQLMMLIPQFWVLALDLWDSRQARTIFPILTGCGLAGGLAAGAFANQATARLGIEGLLWSMALLLVLVGLLHRWLVTWRSARLRLPVPGDSESRVRMLKRSSLLRFLILSLVLAVMISTLVDFQFKYLAERTFPDRQSLTRFFGTFYVVLNGSAIVGQFFLAGWILRNLGLAAAGSVQPATVLPLALTCIVSPIWSLVLALRWAQGVLFQTLGKSTTEIYFMAVRPPDRRRIKAAVDVIAERGADAFVGLFLAVLIAVSGVQLGLLAGLTACLAALLLVVQLRLHREYTHAFRDSLVGRWIPPEHAAESLRTAAARHALLEALESPDERQAILALEFCRVARFDAAATPIRACLKSPSLRVRAAAVRAMQALTVDDEEKLIPAFMTEEDESLRRAAVEYVVTQCEDPRAFVRDLLAGEGQALASSVLDVLDSHPRLATGALTLEWVDRHLRGTNADVRVSAARGLAHLRGPDAEARLRILVADPDLEVRRTALRAIAATGSRAFDAVLLPLLADRDLRSEARRALAAASDRVVPALERMALDQKGAGGDAAARTLSLIASPAARAVLVRLARSEDPTLRHLGTRNLNRIRVARDEPVIARSLAHRLFLRDLGDYRQSRRRARTLAGASEPELRLLSESYAESADRALERACRALACWYEVSPLEGVYRKLRTGDSAAESQALEYLGEILPRREFRILRSMESVMPPMDDGGSSTRTELSECIVRAWEGGDAWLRACAIRATGVVPGIDLAGFELGEENGEGNPLVEAEIERLRAAGKAPRAPAPLPAGRG